MSGASGDRDLAAIDGNTQLTEDDWRDVCLAVSSVSADWKELARNLGLHANLIDSIARENPSSVDDCLSQALIQWLRCNYSQAGKEPPSWRTLAEAVKPLSGRLFADIKKKHPSNRVRSDDGGISGKIEPKPSFTQPPRQTQGTAAGHSNSPTMLVVITVVVAGVAIAVSLGFTNYYTNPQVITSTGDSTTKLSQQGTGDKALFRNFLHMNEKPTMNQLTVVLERGDGGDPVRISDRIGARSSDVGTILLKDDHGVIMHTITANALGKAEAVNREIFRRWLAGSGAPVNWKTLVDALESAQLKALANDIVDALNTLK